MNIFVDTKYEIWQRTYYNLDVDSKEELKEKYGKALLEDTLEPVDSELLFDTMVFIPPQANDGLPTIEIYDSPTGELIMDNAGSE